MKVHTTNYTNTFIEIAEDCPVNSGQAPPTKGEKKSVANNQFEMLHDQPYQYSSDDVFFAVYALRQDIAEQEWEAERQKFFSRGQPCFRASPLTKRYGWGVHSNDAGKVAIYGAETEEYRKLVEDESVRKVKAMKSRR